MSYDSKIASAQKVVEQHNENVTDNPIVFEAFLEKLRKMGGTSDDALKAVSWEDLEECGMPKIMARRMSFVFRKDGEDTGGASAYISPKKVHSLSKKELVERYDPKDATSPVGKKLKDLSGGKAFIVFSNAGKILVDASVKLLEDILDGLPEVKTTFVESRPLPVYRVGDRPDAYADANPLYPNRPLRADEVCDQTGRSWSGIDVSIRQLLYLAITSSKELSIKTVADAGDTLDRVMGQDTTLDTLRSRYPRASQLYDEQEKEGRLPLLKIKLGGQSQGKPNNPFGNPKIF